MKGRLVTQNQDFSFNPANSSRSAGYFQTFNYDANIVSRIDRESRTFIKPAISLLLSFPGIRAERLRLPFQLLS
jgi:hypothetical protein